MLLLLVIFVPINKDTMRTGRPAKEETPFKIILHVNGGKRYASTKMFVVDENGHKQSRHKHWGSLDENVNVPNSARHFNHR
jgi:hypothetical protein